MRWRRTMHILAAAGVVATTACGGGGGGEADPSAVTVGDAAASTTATTEATTTTSTTAPSAEAAVEQAFYEQWDAFIAILSDPDPANPLIDRYFTGRARETLLDTISADVRSGYVTERPNDPELFRPMIVRLNIESETVAIVEECLVDGLIVKRRESGDVVNDTVVTSEITNTFVLEDGVWKLDSAVQRDRVEGVGGCAES